MENIPYFKILVGYKDSSCDFIKVLTPMCSTLIFVHKVYHLIPKSWNLFWLESNWFLTELKEFNTSTNFWGVEMCILFCPLFFLAVSWNLSNNVIYLFSYYELCLSIIWQTVGVQYKYAFDVRYSQCGGTVSEGANFFMYRGSPDKVLFIYRCSKNWQKCVLSFVNKWLNTLFFANFYCSDTWKVL